MTYRSTLQREPDFVVEYQWRSEVSQQPFQEMRCDWRYEGDDPATDGNYMIWPEFLGPDGTELPKEAPIPAVGLAQMWVCLEEMRPYHQQRIKVGSRGHFVVGARILADAVIVRI